MYAKVRKSLWEGSLAGSGETWAVFVYLLAHADPNGFVDVHPKVIARMTGFSEAGVTKALGELEAADFSSRTPDAEGRRIVRVDEHRTWGWHITNYEKYRNDKDLSTVREQTRARQRRFRDKSRNVTGGDNNVTVTLRNAPSRQVEVEVEEEVEETESKTGTLELTSLKGETWTPSEKQEAALRFAYRGLDLESEFAKMRSWLATNPMKQKTLRGLPKFANSWLSRAAEKAPKPAKDSGVWYD